jgi:hypothetical protein
MGGFRCLADYINNPSDSGEAVWRYMSLLDSRSVAARAG